MVMLKIQNNSCELSVTQPLLFADFEFNESTFLKTILETKFDAEIAYFVEVDTSYPGSIEQKTNFFLLRRDFEKEVD